MLPSRIAHSTKNFSIWVHTQVARHTSKFKYSAAWLALFAAYLALAIVATYPLTFQATNHVFGLGTPPLNIWALSWVNRQLVQDPLSLFDGGSNLNVVSGLDSKSDVSVGMNPSTGPRTRLERAGPRSGPARSQTWRSGCRVPGHTPSVSTRGVGSADYPPVRIFAAIGTSRGELEERRSHKPGETFSRPNPTLSTPVFVNLRGASRDLPDQRSEFPMRGACRDPTQIHCVEHLASAG